VSSLPHVVVVRFPAQTLSAYGTFWRHGLQFGGRTTRRPFCEATVVDTLVLGGTFVVSRTLFDFYALVRLIPQLALWSRRFHDLGQPAWWLLTLLVLGLGPIFCSIWAMFPGTPAANRWGPPPVSLAA